MELSDKLKQLLPEKEPELVAKFGYKIPVCTPYFADKEIEYAANALQKVNISGGIDDFIKKFEVEFAKATGAAHATACNSGTSALHVAYRLIGIERGDEVIVPDFTMVSTVTPLIELGAIPVFVDCDDSGNINVDQIEDKITEKTKAIVGVHIYGEPVNIDAIQEIANNHNLKIVYDAAEAHGAKYLDKPIGRFGDVVCYSFYANKLMTTGEGGMITTNNLEYKKKADKLVDEYFSNDRHFWHEDYGYSYRMSNILAAIGLAQVENLKLFVEARRKTGALYMERLKDVPGISFLTESEDSESVRWMHGILVDPDKFPMNRNELRIYLGQNGIETRTFFIPMHLQPCMQKFINKDEQFPMSEKLCAQGMYLPSATAIADHTVVYICDRIKEIIK